MDRGALTRYPGEKARFEIQISILGTREGARYVLIRCPTTVQPIDERDIKQTKGIPSVRVYNISTTCIIEILLLFTDSNLQLNFTARIFYNL